MHTVSFTDSSAISFRVAPVTLSTSSITPFTKSSYSRRADQSFSRKALSDKMYRVYRTPFPYPLAEPRAIPPYKWTRTRLSSKPGELPPEFLTEPYVILSHHTA
ncbi:hypothetical protein, partial [Membranihabitans maritimus]|uniref:hypothetical protein n=1 Tax=Membranihabitans maritimus TaxID=2904244 RepID=UPI001F3CF6C4